jgi:KDO2-lipid IV(A) lauroyltransferase
VVAFFMDQDSKRVTHGTFVDFFGHLAWTPTGAAVLNRATGAPMVLAAVVREPDDTYRCVIDPPIDPVRTRDPDYDDWENTRRATASIQGLIERYPDQWVWFHRRWRRRPPDDWKPPEPPAG